MLKDLEYPKSKEYRSGSKNEPVGFFLNVLPTSKEFKLLLGYFSSSAINVLALGFASFIYNNGKVKMVINHILSSRDKQAILKGNQFSEENFNFSLDNYEQIKQALDEYGQHFFNCLAWLISAKRIEIKVIRPKNNKGISHYKSGVFSDGKSQVRFKSSCNFTAFGLFENLEELGIKQSWASDNERAAIDEYNAYFDSIFNKQADFVEYLPFKDIEEAIITDFGDKNIKELLVDERRLIDKKKSILENEQIRKILDRLYMLENQFLEKLNEPKFPYPHPKGYQITAYKKWKEKGCNGIFAMATGTGKTVTSLNCLLNSYRENKTYKALILVPTIALVNQWKKECKKFNFSNVICVSSKVKWEKDLSFFNTANKYTDTSFIVIVTYASFPELNFKVI